MVVLSKIPRCLEEKKLEISAFRQKSSEVEYGDLFFALKGKKVDGHDFLGEVSKGRGVAAVVSKEYNGENFGLFLFRSDDVLLSLQDLAREQLIKNPVRIVGLTGSVGKTTTKEFLAVLLEAKYRVGKSPGSMNSQISLPLNLLNRKGNEEICVLEMGMSEKGEIAKLVSIAPPEIALITKISPAHIANFKDGLLGIAREKCEIFSQPATKLCVVPQSLLNYLSPQKEFVTFSIEDPKADFFLSSKGTEVKICERGKWGKSFSFHLKENHFKEDFLAAVATARMIGLSWQEIEERSAFVQPPKMRFEKVCLDQVTYINDAYNANPDSVLAALEALPKPKKGGKCIAVLGEMADQGVFSETNHRDIGNKALLKVDRLFCYGKETLPMVQAFIEGKKKGEIFFDKRELFKELKKQIHKNDVVLIKGKRSLEMDEIFSWLTGREGH
jgi:UDP-N-acetylmuramoyl-tripeptide--D-alanyl-D-alanine ligase